MSVLHKWNQSRAAQAGAVVFVTRNLSDVEIGRLYAAVDDFSLRVGVVLAVIPCDELGVCPEHRAAAAKIRGLPASFMGIRSWLRRKLLDAYDCRLLDARPSPQVDTTFEALAVVEERLRTAEEMACATETALADVADRNERLARVREILGEARDAYATALSRYHGAWLASRRLTSVRTSHAPDPSIKDPPI